MYYDYHKIISYNAFINILIGERRSSVKLIGASKLVIQRFLKYGEQFAYIRRYKPELKKAVPNFFDALLNNNEFEGHNLNTSGNKFYCDGVICRLCNDFIYGTGSKTELLFQKLNILFLTSLLLKKDKRNFIFQTKYLLF